MKVAKVMIWQHRHFLAIISHLSLALTDYFTLDDYKCLFVSQFDSWFAKVVDVF